MEKIDICKVLEYYGADVSRVDPDRKYTKIKCPFHGARHVGSSAVYPSFQYFKCYKCDASGDCWSIIRTQERLEEWRDIFQFARDHFGYKGSEVRGAASKYTRYRPSWLE